jgi:hypothetical protein
MITALDPAATKTDLPTSSSQTPTAPRLEGYKTPSHGPSYSPITPKAQLAIEESDAGHRTSSSGQSAPITSANPPEHAETAAAEQSSSFRTPSAPRPDGYRTPPHGPSCSPITPKAQFATENSVTDRQNISYERAAPAGREELEASSAVPDDHTVNSDKDEPTKCDDREVLDRLSTPEPAAQPETRGARKSRAKNSEKTFSCEITSPAEELIPIDASAQGPSKCPILELHPKVIHRIMDILLVYDDPIALSRKSPNRRITEANRSHIITVGKGKITRERQNRTMKSNIARMINTASPTNLFLVCRALRNAGIKTYYNQDTFAFFSEQHLVAWGESIGSRIKEVRKVELRSEWEVVFNKNDIHSKDITMEGAGVLHTTALRVFKNIEKVDLDITVRMPWQRTGNVPNHKDISTEAREMCSEFGRRMAESMANDFQNHELNSLLIDMCKYIKFDEAWIEPWYESAEFKRRDAEYMRKLAA